MLRIKLSVLPFLLFFSCYVVSGQQLRGKIIDELGGAIPRVFVYNKANKQYVFAADDGMFTIDATAGDTLIMKHVGYARKRHVCTQASGEAQLIIDLKERIVALAAVEINMRMKLLKIMGTNSTVSTDNKNAAINTMIINEHVTQTLRLDEGQRLPTSLGPHVRDVPTFGVSKALQLLSRKKRR